MALGTRTCQSCNKRYSGTPRQTSTGRWICPECARNLDAGALAILSNPGDPAPLGEALAIRAFLRDDDDTRR